MLHFVYEMYLLMYSLQLLAKIVELVHLVAVGLRVFYYLAVNKLTTDNMKNSFSLTTKHSGFIKYSLSKLDKIIQINGITFLQRTRENMD